MPKLETATDTDGVAGPPIAYMVSKQNGTPPGRHGKASHAAQGIAPAMDTVDAPAEQGPVSTDAHWIGMHSQQRMSSTGHEAEPGGAHADSSPNASLGNRMQGASAMGSFRQRLKVVGFELAPDQEMKYFQLLRGFFKAQLTKMELQDALQGIFSTSELREHNMFLRDLQSRALHGAHTNVPPLPNVWEHNRSSRQRQQYLLQLKPFSSLEAEQLARAEHRGRSTARRPAKRRRSEGSTPVANLDAAGDAETAEVSSHHTELVATVRKKGTRPRVRTRAAANAATTDRRSRLHVAERQAGGALGKGLQGESNATGTVSTASYRDEAIFQQATADLRQRELLRRSERLDAPAVANAMTVAMAKQRGMPLRRAARLGSSGNGSGDPGSVGYPSLPFSPLPPGLSLDIEIFLKLKRRLVQLLEAVEQMSSTNTGNEVWLGYECVPLGFNGMPRSASRNAVTGIRDEAVALLVHSIEMHVRDLFDVIYGIPDIYDEGDASSEATLYRLRA
jgi:hypothetical protein